jgi:hypothetical protein
MVGDMDEKKTESHEESTEAVLLEVKKEVREIIKKGCTELAQNKRSWTEVIKAIQEIRGLRSMYMKTNQKFLNQLSRRPDTSGMMANLGVETLSFKNGLYILVVAQFIEKLKLGNCGEHALLVLFKLYQRGFQWGRGME